MKSKLILDENTSFHSAIQLLDDCGNGVLPVVDKTGKFIGLITDGDVRRALLNDHLDLEHIINKNPYKLNINTTKQQRLQFLKTIRRRHLPLIDDDGNYMDIFVLDDLEFNSKPNHVVIMAGGLGSRLGNLTEDTPKPMLSVGGMPILEIILNSFIDHGFTKYYFSVNYKKEKIIDYFGNGEKWGVQINYLNETQRLGTGGSLSLIEGSIDHPLIIINGDVLTSLDFDKLLEFHLKKKAEATLCVIQHEFNLPYGVVESSDAQLVTLKEKPTVAVDINAGIYVLNPDVIKYVPENTFYDIPTLFEELLLRKHKTSIYNIRDAWIDIGRSEDYMRAN
ncbi:MAG: nucleotidyltransferase family protein, partial [Gammaproteobacteria bacterium]|nr:nucleotidyltransferase family protein [Gammaproteobacteria bacterium]